MNTQEYELAASRVSDVISTLQNIHNQGKFDEQAAEIYSKQMAFVIQAVPQSVMDEADISLEGFFSNTKEFVTNIIAEAIELLKRLIAFMNGKFGRDATTAGASKGTYKQAKQAHKKYSKTDKTIAFKYVIRNYKDIRQLMYNADAVEKRINASVLAVNPDWQVGKNENLKYGSLDPLVKNIELWAATTKEAVAQIPYDVDLLKGLYTDVGDIVLKVMDRIDDEVIKDRTDSKVHYDHVPNDTLNDMLIGFCEKTFKSVGFDGYMVDSKMLGLVNTRFELSQIGANAYYTVIPDPTLNREVKSVELENDDRVIFAMESTSAKEVTGVALRLTEIAADLNKHKFDGFTTKFDKDTKNLEMLTRLLTRLGKCNKDLAKTNNKPDDQKQIAEFEIQECIKYIEAVIAIRRILLEAITYSTQIRVGALTRIVNRFSESVNKRFGK